MTPIWLVLAMGAGVYALRLAGLVWPDRWARGAPDRALAFVPIALLTALTVVGIGARADGAGLRLLAVLGAALVAYRTRQMWACIVTGMILYGLLSLL